MMKLHILFLTFFIASVLVNAKPASTNDASGGTGVTSAGNQQTAKPSTNGGASEMEKNPTSTSVATTTGTNYSGLVGRLLNGLPLVGPILGPILNSILSVVKALLSVVIDGLGQIPLLGSVLQGLLKPLLYSLL